MKAEQFHSTSAVVVEEDYNSKTCPSCGHLKDDLGSLKIYSCVECFSVFDRDFNAAENIVLKYLQRAFDGKWWVSHSSTLGGGNGGLAMMGPGPFARMSVVSS